MNSFSKSPVSERIIDRAKSLGASLAGIASVELLKKSPSHDIFSKIEQNQGVGSRGFAEGIKPGEIAWPPAARSAVVIALAHKDEEPELDWWKGDSAYRESQGGRTLESILTALSEWIEGEYSINTHLLPYHIEKGGIFFKDSAVMAGLGCIGKNNLLVTPEYGPRVRSWALLLDEEIAPTGPTIYDPCDGCDEPCKKACPQNAFNGFVHSPVEFGMITLPGRNGCYSRDLCKIELEKNLEEAEILESDGRDEPIRCIKFCRRCELSCPVGK
jgi:epoxyqueuosine reductase